MRSSARKTIGCLLSFSMVIGVSIIIECSRRPSQLSSTARGKEEDSPKKEDSADSAKGGRNESSTQVSSRGPGMKGPAHDFLKLPVPPTIDLSHVQPEYYAVALDKDPQRIFEFVRDHVAYEAYSGCLRGPRGTLLAMAGNSVDRAALLASLLEKSGQRIRYAKGTLSEVDAKELVQSMSADRGRPALPKAAGEPSVALKAAGETLVAGIRRDYQTLRDHLKKKDRPRLRVDEPDALAKEARTHYWVQWFKQDKWLDLDPSFAGAVPGQAYAAAEETVNALPEAVFHRITFRIQLEEYSLLGQGRGKSKPASREILSVAHKAADLSGSDILFAHQPEKWEGPAQDIQTAISAAVEDTGRVKPVLLVGQEKWIAGQPFRQQLPSGKGIGGVGALLRGAGTRKAVEVATAESIEIELTAPNGHKELVRREIFDLAGPSRRASGKALSDDEVRAGITGRTAVDVTRNVYDLFFTTGRLDPLHVSGIAKMPRSKEDKPSNIRDALRRINITFAVISDGLLPRLVPSDRSAIVFYPDTPRVQIAEISIVAGRRRLSLDLRRNHTRALALGPSDSDDVFFGQVLRGVADGTLERVLMEYLASAAQGKEPSLVPGVSTSQLFERAQAEGISSALLTHENDPLDGKVADDARARVRADIAGGQWVVSPKAEISVDRQPRFAWWRINPQSGETVAVTDEGLHQAPVEYVVVHSQGRIFVGLKIGGVVVIFECSNALLAALVEEALRNGWQCMGILHR